jgi:hypothetical protein
MEMLCLAHDAEPYGHVLVAGRPPTTKQLASIVGVTVREVERLIAELDEAGVFSVEGGVIYSRRMVRDHAKSLEGKEHIAKRWANKGNGQEPTTPPNRSPTSPPCSLETEAESETEAEKGDTSLRSVSLPRARRAESDFEDFWAAYPRKIGKDAARKAFANAKKRAPIEAIAAGLNSARWPTDPQFIPHPATWLNQGRWQDDPDAIAPEPAGKFDWMRELMEAPKQ